MNLRSKLSLGLFVVGLSGAVGNGILLSKGHKELLNYSRSHPAAQRYADLGSRINELERRAEDLVVKGEDILEGSDRLDRAIDIRRSYAELKDERTSLEQDSSVLDYRKIYARNKSYYNFIIYSALVLLASGYIFSVGMKKRARPSD